MLPAWLSPSPLFSRRGVDLDFPLLASCLALLGLGLVMVASASSDVAGVKLDDPHYYLTRHVIYLVLGATAAFFTLLIPLERWQRASGRLVIAALVLLVVVLLPGIGRSVNGAQRWIGFGGFNVQASELAKLFAMVYMADYLVRREDRVRKSWLGGLLLPMLVLGPMAGLLLLEPDFGATVVLVGSAITMLFLAGVSLWRFLLTVAGVAGIGGFIMMAQTYRMKRLANFTNPWQDPYGDGYQLTQALIAFGRGEWFGMGLGSSVQKQFYLPESHTDFVFSILAEELGLLGSLAAVVLFVHVGLRCWRIGMRAEYRQQLFAAYLAYGLGTLWVSQFLINIGVNVGLLPTKGLTLPFLSYGGSSLIVCCVSMALLLRIDWEVRNGVDASRYDFLPEDFEEDRHRGR